MWQEAGDELRSSLVFTKLAMIPSSQPSLSATPASRLQGWERAEFAFRPEEAVTLCAVLPHQPSPPPWGSCPSLCWLTQGAWRSPTQLLPASLCFSEDEKKKAFMRSRERGMQGVMNLLIPETPGACGAQGHPLHPHTGLRGAALSPLYRTGP